MQQPKKKNSLDAQVVHQAELVRREGVPRVVHLHRACRFATVGVALVHGDAAEVVLEHLHGVEDGRAPVAQPGVQAAARCHQQREAGAGLLVVDADVSVFVERHLYPLNRSQV